MMSTSSAHGNPPSSNDSVVINGVRFVGATMWTDFCVHGAAARKRALKEAPLRMNDYRLISFEDQELGSTRTLQVTDTLQMHAETREFLAAELSQAFANQWLAAFVIRCNRVNRQQVNRQLQAGGGHA